MSKKTFMYIKPKTHIYTGIHDHIPTKITQITFDQKTISVLEGFRSETGGKHYIKVVGLSDVNRILALKEVFPVDALTLEDVFNVNQRNKIELHEHYVFAAFNLSYPDSEGIKDDYMSLIMTKDTVISFHETDPAYLRPLVTLLENDEDVRAKPVDYLFYAILDIITDNHLDIYEALEENINNVETEILETKEIAQEDFYLVRKQLLKLKSHVAPILEQLSVMLEKGSGLFHLDHQEYYHDLKDHLERLDMQISQSRESMRQILDLHMNNQSTRMNQIMTTLTVFSAVFIPLSFLTGFFGMNFVHFGVLSYEHAVILFLLGAFVIVAMMLVFFKTKKWF